jgi:hypothetical protein
MKERAHTVQSQVESAIAVAIEAARAGESGRGF